MKNNFKISENLEDKKDVINEEEYTLEDLKEFSLEEKDDALIEGNSNELIELKDDEVHDVELIELPTIDKYQSDFMVDAYVNNQLNDDFLINNFDLDSENIKEVNATNIDVFSDKEAINRILVDFKEDTWCDLTNEERKKCLNNLKEFIEQKIGLEENINLEFYSNENEGDYAYVTGDGETIAINEYNLWDAKEAVDSISHELWHAYQHQRADMLENETDYMYKDGFENYIQPEIDFNLYQEQFVESDAREFAQRFKDYLEDL